MNQKIATILIAAALITTCGCVGSKPVHDFEINETREFEFLHEGDLTFTGNLTWDGEHFYIRARFQGYPDGVFTYGFITGQDNDVLISTYSRPTGAYNDEHVDLSRSVLLNEMIKNRVDKTGINDSR